MGPRVFVSYSHDSELHREQVLALTDQLRAHGVDAILDRYDPSPDQGWPRWTQDELAMAHRVLIVCTPTYRLRFEGRAAPGVGRGVTWEGHIVTQLLYDRNTSNTVLRAVLLEGGRHEDVPHILRPYTIYRLPADYEALYRWLTDQNEGPPPLGPLRRLPRRRSSKQ